MISPASGGTPSAKSLPAATRPERSEARKRWTDPNEESGRDSDPLKGGSNQASRLSAKARSRPATLRASTFSG
jgi:hypothetical protein